MVVDTELQTANRLCVKFLRELLEMAENGQVTGVGVVQHHSAGGASYKLSGDCSGYPMLGAISRMSHMLNKVNDQDN
jgi:hypothetical protein